MEISAIWSWIKKIPSLLKNLATLEKLASVLDKVKSLEDRIAALEKKLERCPGEACGACGELALWETEAYISRKSAYRIVSWKCQACGYETKTNEK